jgi:hypothetical protein
MQEGRRREPHPAMRRYRWLERKFTSAHPETGTKKYPQIKRR